MVALTQLDVLRFDGGIRHDDGDVGYDLASARVERQNDSASQIAVYESNGLFKLSDESLPIRGPGLKNDGNTCYAAAVVQLLRASTTFVALIQNANNTLSVSCALRATFQAMVNQPETAPCQRHIIGKLLQEVRSNGGNFPFETQCDAG